MKRELIAEKPFEFSARVTMQLGRESISSSTVAISELIKNSYDADSSSVKLDFNLNQADSSQLIIEDDGIGMSIDTLVEHWLKIGTDNKSKIERSPVKSRVLTGAKGLGRLGIDRLCKKLVLYTKTADMDKAIQLEVDWSRFENTNKALSEIQHKIYEVELPIVDEHGKSKLDVETSGTRMVLEGLKDNWDDKFLDTLENELRLLVSPFQAKNEFSIFLRTNNGDDVKEKNISSEDILNVARWKVEARVDENGLISVSYHNRLKKETIKQDPIAWNLWIKNSGITPQFGPVNFEFHWLVQDITELNKVNLKAKNFREFMRLNQGVRLYRDHFRVRPYGEPSGKGDWLDLGLRKVSSPGAPSQGGWRIGPNQIVGSVLISRETNSILNDQANREGIVENEAFYQLRSFLIKVIETFETLVHKDAAGDKKTDLSEELAQILAKSNKDVENAIEKIKVTLSKPEKKKSKAKKTLSQEQIIKSRLSELEKLTERQKKAEKLYLDALKNEKEVLEEQKNTLSNLASIGILTVSFGHEVRQHSGIALNGVTRALSHLQKIDDPDEKLAKPKLFTKIAMENAQYVDNFSRFALENIKPDKRKRRKVYVPDVFEHVFRMFEQTLSKMKVETEVNVIGNNGTYDVFAFEIDWESIAINFMTNSIWAIESNKDRLNSKISVDLFEEDNHLFINYKDSGIGLESGTEESIFFPMNSSKRDKQGNSTGTGMGLAIVKNHIEENMNGTISALAKSSLGGAEFQIRIPKGLR